MKNYMTQTDRYGKIWIWTAAVVVLMVPVAICVYYNAWPSMTAVLKGLLGVAPIYWTVGCIEVLTYTPMLGVGGTYLAFVTGNLTSLKAPSALSAMENAGVKPGNEEGEVISTIAIATCSIVTTIVIVIGVCVLRLISPVLDSPVMKPAFDNILPALFGGLGVVYISKNVKLAIAPLAFMIGLFLCVPGLAGSVGVLVPVGVLIALGAGRVMYKKGWL